MGYNGLIIKSTDGGDSWKTQNSGVSKYLTSVYFTDANRGYAVGEHGTILKTKDGGTTWTLQAEITSKKLFSVYFPSTDRGYAVGAEGAILKTADTGKTWTVLTSGISSALFCVRFTDVNAGYATGGYGVILKTINGGRTWVSQASHTTRDIYCIQFPTVDTVYAGGFATNSGSGGVLRATVITAKQAAAKRSATEMEMGRNGELVFDMPHRSRVKITVLDLQGRLLAKALEEVWEPGPHLVDVSGVNLPHGFYLLDLMAEGYHRAIRFNR